jgi:hypothetical protein
VVLFLWAIWPFEISRDYWGKRAFNGFTVDSNAMFRHAATPRRYNLVSRSPVTAVPITKPGSVPTFERAQMRLHRSSPQFAVRAVLTRTSAVHRHPAFVVFSYSTMPPMPTALICSVIKPVNMKKAIILLVVTSLIVFVSEKPIGND